MSASTFDATVEKGKKKKKKKKKKKDKIPDHLSSWEEVSGNRAPSKIMYFRPKNLLQYDFFRLIVNTIDDPTSKEGKKYQVDNRELEKLYGYFTLERIPGKTTVYYQNDRAFDMRIMLSGKVKLSKETITGITQTRVLEDIGSRFGENSIGGRKFRDETATTETPATFLVLSLDAYARMCTEMPKIAADIEKVLDNRKESTLEDLDWLEECATKLAPYLQVSMVAAGQNIFEEVPAIMEGADGPGDDIFPSVSSLAASWQACRHMYIVSDGRVRLHREGRDGWEMVLRRTDAFGVHGLLYGTARFVSATATKPCVLLKLDHAHFKEATKEMPQLLSLLQAKALKLSLQYLRPSSLFSCISDDKYPTLEQLFEIEEKRPGNVIVPDDDSDSERQTFVVLVAGRVSSSAPAAKSPQQSFGFGSWFGQDALLGVPTSKSAQHRVTAKTISPCAVLTLPQKRFTDFLQLLPSRSVFEDADATNAHSSSKAVSVDDLVKSPLPVSNKTIAKAKRRSAEDMIFQAITSSPKKISDSPRASDGSLRWMYRDPDGNIYGPFATSQMRQWHSLHYFLPDVPMKFSTSQRKEATTDSTGFVPMRDIFPEEALAFTFNPSPSLFKSSETAATKNRA